jgi:hypothetical protein
VIISLKRNFRGMLISAIIRQQAAGNTTLSKQNWYWYNYFVCVLYIFLKYQDIMRITTSISMTKKKTYFLHKLVHPLWYWMASLRTEDECLEINDCISNSKDCDSPILVNHNLTMWYFFIKGYHQWFRPPQSILSRAPFSLIFWYSWTTENMEGRCGMDWHGLGFSEHAEKLPGSTEVGNFINSWLILINFQ